MRPYYEHAGITIYHGECRAVLSALTETFDVLLTDPPYGLGIAANPIRQMYDPDDWDAEPPTEGTLQFIRARAARHVIWGGNYLALPPSQGFYVWDKCQPEGLTLSMCEQAWCSVQSPAKLFRQSVLSYRKEHPTEKPVNLMKWCLKQMAPVASVLDPFMGSGTTLVAAKGMCPAVGIDVNERYCEIAAKRLQQEVLPLGVSA